MGCLEERIEGDLAQGDHAEVVGELEGLVNEHPLREQLRCQLMLAPYRAGRQAEALDTYQHGRAILVNELGIEPGRALRELHQAILNQDPSLDSYVAERSESPAQAALALPASAPESVGRDVRKTVTAVCVGIAISSAPGEALDPEALRRVTSRAVGAVEAVIERHGGTIETITGDTVIAVFGLPLVHEDDALRGLRAGAEVRDALSALADELRAAQALDLDFRAIPWVALTSLRRRHASSAGSAITASRTNRRAASSNRISRDIALRLRRDESLNGSPVVRISGPAPRAVTTSPVLIPVRNVRGVQGVGVDLGWADRVLTEAVEAATTNGPLRRGGHAPTVGVVRMDRTDGSPS